MELEIADLAQDLDLPIETLHRWIRQGRIPVHRQGDLCLFKRAILERWALKHNLRFSTHRSDRPALPEPEPTPDDLLTAMKRGGVFHDIAASDRDSALQAVVARIPGLSEPERKALLEGLREREQMSSTGIGNGVAIPHPRMPIEEVIDKACIYTFFLAEPVDFSAVDDRPVFVLFVMLCPSIQIHLQLLSRLSFCVRDSEFISFLRQVPDQASLFSRIAEFERTLDAAESG